MKTEPWNEGAPPHVGWWDARVTTLSWADPEPNGSHWGWWDGKKWSTFAAPDHTKREAAGRAREPGHNDGATWHVRWSHYWPENARVPRIDPRQETGHA